ETMFTCPINNCSAEIKIIEKSPLMRAPSQRSMSIDEGSQDPLIFGKNSLVNLDTIVEENSENNSQNKEPDIPDFTTSNLPSKRVGEATSAKSSNKKKKSANREDSPILKRLIQKLSTNDPRKTQTATSASMKMTEINNSQRIPQEVKDFFKNNSTWSLLKFLQYRERTESFTYEKDKEHMFYKSALTMISDEQAQLCLLNFEVKYMRCVIPQPAGFVLAGERGVRLPSALLNILHVSCHDAIGWREKISQSVDNFWSEIEKKHLKDNIEKGSLGYIIDVIDDSAEDSKIARKFLSNELKSFVTSSLKRDCSHVETSQDHSNFHTPDHSKKTRTDMSNLSFDEYTNAVNAVNSVQNDKESAHTNPLWWGVLDFREENVSPSPSLPRAKNFLSANEIDRLMNMTQNAIQEENEKISKSAKSLLEALLLSEIVSLQLLAKECGARGVVGVCDLLQRSAGKMQDVDNKKIIQNHLANVDADDATIYIGRCIEDSYEWISRFHGQCQSERTVDMFLVGPFAKTPQTIFTYGENHSDADRGDKTDRSGTSRVGKSCDFLYW
ncbi:17256_t:CDS:10, partial [Dentiscutata heterogama]